MYVMATVPKKYVKEGRTWLKYFQSMDCHKWIIALEHGTGGLVHWQLRYSVRNCDTKDSRQNYFDSFKRIFPEGHMEFTENWCDYERKEGWFVCSDDNDAILKVRFGPMYPNQRRLLDDVDTQNDRQVDVYLDKQGCHGKSWMSIHLYERGKALVVPRYCTTARAIHGYICSSYAGQPYIIIDIPRAGKPNRDIYEAIEEIKDGLVFDERYSGKCRNVRGCKVIVFTNTALDKKALSKDRWRLHGIKGEPLL